MSNSTVQEGFLCPACLTDCGDVNNLQQHFLAQHSSSNDGAYAFQLKGILDRAKATLKNFEPSIQLIAGAAVPLYTADAEVPSVVDDVPELESFARNLEQEPGPFRVHTRDFKSDRESTVNQLAVQTNQLIIRLDKIVSNAPDDMAVRKAFEKSLVQWSSNSDSPICRLCMQKFNITRRKHHCRLCGQIMCIACSRFLTFAYARKLTDPSYAANYADKARQNEREKRRRRHRQRSASPAPKTGGMKSSLSSNELRNPSLAAKFLAAKAEELSTKVAAKVSQQLDNAGSTADALSSFLNQDGEEHVRICRRCRELLDRRDEQVQDRTQPPPLKQLYEQLATQIQELQKLHPSFCRMAESLQAGESDFDIASAQEMRIRMMKINERIDVLSKGISKLDPSSCLMPGDVSSSESEGATPSPPATTSSSRYAILQRNIRMFSTSTMQDVASRMPALPTEAEYKELHEQYRQSYQQKVEREQRMAVSAQRSMAHAGSPGRVQNLRISASVPVQHDSGWSAEFEDNDTSSFGGDESQADMIDPISQQIGLIRRYIKQAIVAGRLDEVETLQRNLRELEEEQERMQESTMSARGPNCFAE